MPSPIAESFTHRVPPTPTSPRRSVELISLRPNSPNQSGNSLRPWDESSHPSPSSTTHTEGASGALSPQHTGDSHMKRQTRSKAAAEAATNSGQENGTMSIPVEHRRRYSAVDGTTTQAAQLMSLQTFSLDNDPDLPQTPLTPKGHDSGTSFFDLPVSDRRNFLLLVLLYFLQGIPMGLATGSVPFLLKSHLSYGQIGVFSLASYPYSLKLLWSPIVDAVWSPKVGRRKSWILPVQAFSGVSMLWLGSRITEMMKAAGTGGEAGVWRFTFWWFFLVFTCATQDIAVDGKFTYLRRCFQRLTKQAGL